VPPSHCERRAERYSRLVRYSGIIVALLGLGVGGASIGCGTSLSYIPTRERPHTLYMRRPEQVEIFMTGKPDRPFVEIGMIESQQDSMSQDDARGVVAKMRAFAGTRGCDALVIFAGNDAISDPGGDLPASMLKGYRGSCLVYVDGPPLAGAPPPPPSAAELGQSQPAAAAALSCMANATQLCYGPGGCRGGQRCADGKAWTVCDCGGATAQVHPPASQP
jgi:hypothetical protein